MLSSITAALMRRIKTSPFEVFQASDGVKTIGCSVFDRTLTAFPLTQSHIRTSDVSVMCSSATYADTADARWRRVFDRPASVCSSPLRPTWSVSGLTMSISSWRGVKPTLRSQGRGFMRSWCSRRAAEQQPVSCLLIDVWFIDWYLLVTFVGFGVSVVVSCPLEDILRTL